MSDNMFNNNSIKTYVYSIIIFIALIAGLLLPSLLGSVMTIVILCLFLFFYEYHTILENILIVLKSNLNRNQ